MINTELREGTGIETRTGMVTDEHLETAVPCIYSAGTCAEFYDPTAERHYRMATWNSAGAYGKLAAHNMTAHLSGADRKQHDIVPEYSSLVLSGHTITQFGPSPEYRDDSEPEMHIDRDKAGTARSTSSETASSARC